MKLEVFLKSKIKNLNTYAYAVARLVEALGYKPEVRGFDSRWGHSDISLTQPFGPHYGPEADLAPNSTRDISWG